MTAVIRPEDGAFFDLSARTKLRLSGTDRVRYLNGQISNDLRKATESAAIHACVLNVKGKVNADVFISAQGESFLLDADDEVRETLPIRLERYIIADDVQIEDVTEQFALFHVIGAEPPALATAARHVHANRWNCAGTDIWVESAAHDQLLRDLAAVYVFCDSERAESFRIEQGIPRSGRELTEEIIPIEANLEEKTVDYTKGCYIGQEVISRMKMSGQTNKRLCGFIVIEGRVLAGMRLNTSEGKAAGWVTSATDSARLGKQIALGYLKRGFQAVGLELQASLEGQGAARVQVAALPFV